MARKTKRAALVLTKERRAMLTELAGLKLTPFHGHPIVLAEGVRNE
jgi:hypothetical protein